MSDIESFFNTAEECSAYQEFCENQEREERFQLDRPALVCRWRMSRKRVPLLNRHIRALSQRVVSGEPLTHNMLSWAKQHVEWSLTEGVYDDPSGVLMLVIDVNGNAAMSVGPYEPLEDTGADALLARAQAARDEAASTRVAPELLAAVAPDGRLLLAAGPDEHLCGAATLVEQLAATRGMAVERSLAAGAPASAFVATLDEGAAPFLVSDEHGVVPAAGMPDNAAAESVRFLSDGVAKLFL